MAGARVSSRPLSRSHRIAGFGLLALGIFLADPCQAQKRDAAAAELLFQEGRKASEAGDFESACPKFEESQRLDPGAGTLVNLARCYEKLGRIASAWDRWSQALRLLRRGDERRPAVQRHLDAAAARLPRLTVRLSPDAAPGARVVRDGIELRSASLGLPLPVDPGARTIEVVASGYEPKTFTIEVEEGKTSEIVVTTGPKAKAAAPVPAPSPKEKAQPVSPRASKSSSPVLGYVVGGLGIAGIGLGSATGIIAIKKKNDVDADCDRDESGALFCGPAGLSAADKGSTMSTVSTIGFAVGAAGLGLGLYLVLSHGGDEGVTAIGPSFAPGAAGARLLRTF